MTIQNGSVGAVCKDVHGRNKWTTHFFGTATKDATGIYGVHVYLPEMHWAKRLIQNAIASWE